MWISEEIQRTIDRFLCTTTCKAVEFHNFQRGIACLHAMFLIFTATTADRRRYFLCLGKHARRVADTGAIEDITLAWNPEKR